VDAVVLGPSRAHDEDRRADALGARRLDQPPAVHSGQHQVEDDDVGALVAQPRQAGLAARHEQGVEASLAEVRRHSAADHLVVLDDENLSHASLA
jgi:hypothetical protein